MKKTLFTIGVFLMTTTLLSQKLLDAKTHENLTVKKKIITHDEKGLEIVSEEDKEIPNIGLTGNILSSFDNVGFRPDVKFRGSYENGKNFYDLELSFLSKSNDSARLENSVKIFVPEFSDNSFNLWYTRILSDNAALTGLISYGNKNLYSIDTVGSSSDNIGVFSGKLGLEYVLVEDFLCIYANIQYTYIATNRTKFEEYFGEDVTDSYTTFAGGISYKVTEGIFKDVFIDFSAIYITDPMKKVYQNDDSFIPLLKIGINRYLHYDKNKP